MTVHIKIEHFRVLILLILLPQISNAEPLEVHEVAAGIYVHEGNHEDFDAAYHGDIANIGFIVGDEAVAVVDTGGSYLVGKKLREAVRAVTKLPIKYVINTHVHPDHIFGNAAFEDEQAIFVGHDKLPGEMYARQETYLRNLKIELGSESDGSRIILPAMTVKTEVILELGHRAIRLNRWPTAHTDTDLTVYDNQTKTLWTGDLLFAERTPSLDGDIKGWISLIDRLKQERVNTIVPGHGHVSNEPDQVWDKEKTYLQTLLRDVRRDIKSGKEMTDSMNSAAQSERSKWVLFDVVNRRNVNRLYPELEWED